MTDLLISAGVVFGVIVSTAWFLRRRERKSSSAAAPEPIVFVLNGQPRTEEHITEDLIGDAMHTTGEEWFALLAAMEKHATHCPRCDQNYNLNIGAIRLMQSNIPPHLSPGVISHN